jgi:hypothetical protein
MAKKVNDVEANVGIITKQLLAYLKSQEKLAAELDALGEGAEGAVVLEGGAVVARSALNELD